MDKQIKVFQNKASDINAEDRTIIFTLSDQSIDRDNEVLMVKGAHWGEGKQSPPFLWGHNHSLPPIGKFQWIKRVNKSIRGKVEFAPTEHAMSIFELYKGDYINSVSVGFIPEEWEDKAEWEEKEVNRLYKKWELLEASAVDVGSNRNAIRRAYENGELKIAEMVYKSFNFKDKPEENSEEETPIEEIESDKDLKPYPNEHSCDINTKKYPKYRRVTCEQKSDGKCIDVVYGITADKKSEISSLRYKKDIWTETEAKAHCKKRKGKFEPAKSEEDNEDKTNTSEKSKEKLIKEAEKLGLVLVKSDSNEFELDNIKEDIKEINLDEMEVPKTGLENSDKDLDISEKEYQELLTGIKKEISESLVREFRTKILGEIVD